MFNGNLYVSYTSNRHFNYAIAVNPNDWPVQSKRFDGSEQATHAKKTVTVTLVLLIWRITNSQIVRPPSLNILQDELTRRQEVAPVRCSSKGAAVLSLGKFGPDVIEAKRSWFYWEFPSLRGRNKVPSLRNRCACNGNHNKLRSSGVPSALGLAA